MRGLNKYINPPNPNTKFTISLKSSSTSRRNQLASATLQPILPSSKPLFTISNKKPSLSLRQRMSWPAAGDWMCGACQHVNFKKRDQCQRCQYPKCGGPDPSTYGYNRTEVLAGDWYCNAMNCGAHNYASRSQCYMCGSFKGDYGGGYGGHMMGSEGYSDQSSVPPGWKTGDWFCTRAGCGEHNYASRTVCYKCKAARDYGGEV